MKLRQLMDAAASSALATGISIKDHHFLLAELLNCPPVELPLRAELELAPSLCDSYFAYERRLRRGEPPQYLIGKAWFYGLELAVRPGVLIPRPETEGLVELALGYLKEGDQVLDLGTGSGAIAIALSWLKPGLRVCATDIAPAALELAEENAARHGCGIRFIQADLFPEGVFDLIISNPPYISAAEYEELEPRVRLFEPKQALLARENGLEFYRRILGSASAHLSVSGLIAFEHGAAQRGEIMSLASGAGFRCLAAKQDLAGRDRYLVFEQAT